MNVITKNVMYTCDMHNVAPFAGFSISIFDFKDAEPFGSAFFCHPRPSVSAGGDPYILY